MNRYHTGGAMTTKIIAATVGISIGNGESIRERTQVGSYTPARRRGQNPVRSIGSIDAKVAKEKRQEISWSVSDRIG